MRTGLLATVMFAIAFTGCFEAKSPVAGSPTPSTTISSESIFPHKSNWKDPAQHGLHVKDILGLNATTCMGCHNEANTVSGGAPSCRSCHKNFPHTEPGVTFETHGAYVIANGKGACATQCHGADFKGGLSGKPCTECHKVYPHANAWSTPAIHGPEAKGDLKNNCTSCHGSDLKGGDSKVSCYTCHKEAYPHPQGWSAPDQHGKFVLTNGTGKCATQCHGIQLDGGLSGTSCGGDKGCHTVWPHPNTGWMAVHGQTARSISLSGCLGCHKNDATGGKTGVACTQCHDSLPAHQDTDWSKTGHGKLVMQQPVSLTDPKGCPLCHGAKLEGGKTPTLPGLKALKGCKDCHASYPALHKPAADAPAWNSFEGHGKWVMSQVDISKGGVMAQITELTAACKLCHGEDLNGGTTGKGCYVNGCHTSFPHPPTALGYSPWISKHGVFANAETPKATSCATGNCHGVDLQGLPVGEKEVGKKLVKGCEDCHMKMPHLPLGQWDHGQSVLVAGTSQLDIKNCAQCHGDTWKGKGDAPSCYTCHNTFPLPHRASDGEINTTWRSAAEHGVFVMANYSTGSVKNTAATPCKLCHGSDLNGGVSKKTCYKCHKSFPHAAAPVTANGITYTFTDLAWDGLKGFANSHGQYVVARAALYNATITQQITSECAKSCHGKDLLGGTSKKSCFTCHKSYPHTADWVKPYDAADTKTPGGTHGLYALKNGNTSCLTGCHGTDGSGGTSGKACTTCHDYPHKANWKSGSNSPEYPPHALSVVTTNNTADKADDSVNAAGFAECAKCHGGQLVFLQDHYPLTTAEQWVTLDAGATVPRCTQCHNFPHPSVLFQGGNDTAPKPYPWKVLHWVALQGWQAAAKINEFDPTAGTAFSQQTCGSAGGASGCHATGPWPAKKVDLDGSGFNGCNYCHMKP